jgi:hypothetical protein
MAKVLLGSHAKERFMIIVSLWLLIQTLAAEATAMSPAVSVQAPAPYAELVGNARKARAKTQALAKAAEPSFVTRPQFFAYAASIEQIGAENLSLHAALKLSGADNDLKCILKGVAIDLRVKLDAIKVAPTQAALKTAFADMSDLLRDNIEVLTTPATTQSGMDCLIEFGDPAKP